MDVKHKLSVPSVLHALLLNPPLNTAMQANLELLGPIAFDAAEQQFGRTLQKAYGHEATGYDGKVLPFPETPFGGGIVTDVGEVSWNAPTVGFAAAVLPSELSLHTWAATAATGTPAANKAAVYASKAIALMAVDLLTDAALLERAQAVFQESTRGKPYAAGIPVDQPPPDPSAPRP
jgi:aminobenzoyl-glutamate utilization protein B